MLSAVLSALGALKGPLHDGAPGPVLAMLERIGSADKAETWCDRTWRPAAASWDSATACIE